MGDETFDSISNDVEYVIGIDLGTTNSCVGVWKNGQVEIIANQLGSNTTPSWVAFTENFDKIVGTPARRQSSNNPKRTIFDVKRLMGRRMTDIEEDLENYPYEIIPDQRGLPVIRIPGSNSEADRTFKPEEISAMILQNLKSTAENYLGVRVKKAVITVPAYFNDYQRQATKDASMIAGLECLRIINEPTAACLCYGLNRENTDLNVLVFDLGGGTLDVSVLNLDEGVFQVISTCGDSHLGGEDIDWLLVKHITSRGQNGEKMVASGVDLSNDGRRLKRLQLACEQAKRELSNTQMTQILLESFYPDGSDLEYNLSKAEFETVIEPILKRAFRPVKQALRDADMEPEEIREIVLVGGSTRIPILQEQLSRYFNNRRLNKSINPDEAVAYGATVQAAILHDTSETSLVKDLVLLDVTPLSLGIETCGGIMAKIIERNTNIPCRQSKMFTTAEDNQESVLIQVYEGERKFTADCQQLGTFELGPIPEAPRGVPKIEVTFAIDSNGILQVSALDKNTGLGTDAKLTPESGRLSGEEIQEMIRQADKFKVQDELKQACLEEITQFERYLYSVQEAINNPEINEHIGAENISFVNQYVINSFQWIQDNRDNFKVEEIKNARQSVEYGLKPYMTALYSYGL